MSVIRFNTDEVFETDSFEYEILSNAAASVGATEGAIVEIGTRRGGSAKIIIDSLVRTNNNNRNMFCIDPYGNIDFMHTNKSLSAYHPNLKLNGDPESTEIVTPLKLHYTNNMRNRIIPSLYFYAYQNGINFTFFCLEDTEFFNRYSDGVPVYDQYKTIVNDYAFVFFDGPHVNESVELETNFFMERSNVGTVFVYDDIWVYDHDKVQKMLFENNFELMEKQKFKASYKKIK